MPSDRRIDDYAEEAEPRRAPAGEPLDEAWWRRVYLAVIIFTALVILSFWAFSRAFSS